MAWAAGFRRQVTEDVIRTPSSFDFVSSSAQGARNDEVIDAPFP